MTAVRPIYVLAGVTVVAVIAVVYYFFDPSDPTGAAFFPRCPFLTLTGLKCPGCGSQRAIHALMHGEIAEAWRLNALLLIELPLIALLLLSGPLSHRLPILGRLFCSRTFILLITTIIILWTIFRNIVNI